MGSSPLQTPNDATMDALAILNSLADPGTNETVKHRDAEIRGYIASTKTCTSDSIEALVKDPRRAFEVGVTAAFRASQLTFPFWSR